MPRGAISRSTRSPPIRSSGEVHDYFGGLDDLAGASRALHRRSAHAHRRGSSAHPALLPLPCALRRGAPDPAGLAACAARANDLMALSRERIADELLKLLGASRPGADGRADGRTAASSRRSCPKSTRTASARSPAWPRGRQRPASPPIRCVGSPPCSPPTGDRRRGRRRGSGCPTRRGSGWPARRTRGEAHATARPRSLTASGSPARSTACCSTKRSPEAAAAAVRRLEGLAEAALPLTGGELIARGLEAGPVVARTMQAIERDWIDGGFSRRRGSSPRSPSSRLAQALRESQ